MFEDGKAHNGAHNSHFVWRISDENAAMKGGGEKFSRKEYEETRRRLQELQKPKRCAVEPPSPTRRGGRLSAPGSPISEAAVMPEMSGRSGAAPRDRVGRREVRVGCV